MDKLGNLIKKHLSEKFEVPTKFIRCQTTKNKDFWFHQEESSVCIGIQTEDGTQEGMTDDKFMAIIKYLPKGSRWDEPSQDEETYWECTAFIKNKNKAFLDLITT